ncbi:MAG: ABC transporter substrate-binding protein [Geminicoccaceae bacterium]
MTKDDHLKQLAMSGRLTRRDFVAYASALGIGAAASSSMFASTAKAQPARGGDVRIGHAHGSTTDSLDPGTWENDFTIELSFAANNFLTEIAADGSLAGELAESWEASDDAAQWTFVLRKDVTFHNGKTVTAADVIASFNHHRGEGSESAAGPIVSPITDIQADGDNVVVFTLNGGNADFPYLVSDYHIPIKPAEGEGIDWQSGVGCGPYVMESWEPGVSARFKRHDGYWKSDRAWFDTIEYTAVVDAAARGNALVTGEVHVISRPDLKTVELLARRPGIDIEETSGTAHYGFPMRVDATPFDNNDVREALKWAVDREELVQKILKGRGVVGNDHPISPANRYLATEEELPQRTYDPDKAKFHLKQAGMENLQVNLQVAEAAFAGAVNAAELYREQAAAAGIDLVVVREPDDGYWSNIWNVQPFTGTYWGGRPTEDWMFTTTHDKNAEWNETAFKDDEFQGLLEQARSELDETKRREMYVEMQRIVSTRGGSLIPMFNNYVWAKTEKLKHEEQMAANWDLDGHKWQERWWLEG